MNRHTSKAKETRERLIAVLGMHRSGTSAITRALKVLGVELGDRLLPADQDINAAGYWEDIDLNQLNIGLLRALDTDWHHLAPLEPDFVERLRAGGHMLRAVDLLREKVDAHGCFGFKDPRVTLLLPFWKEVFSHCSADISYVLVVRNPISVVKSLARRDQFDPEKSALLWLIHCVTMLEQTVGEHSRVLVDYDMLMRSPEQELRRMAAALGLAVEPAELHAYVAGFLNTELRHTTYDWHDLKLSSFTRSLVHDFYGVLLDAAGDKVPLDAPAMKRELGKARQELDRWHDPLRLVDSLYHFKRAASQTIADRDARVQQLNTEMREARVALDGERQAVVQREALAKTLQALVEDAEEKRKNADQALDGNRGEIERLKRVVDVQQQQVLSLTAELVALKDAVAARESRLQAVEELAQRRIDTLSQALDLSERKVATLTAERDSFSALSISRAAALDDALGQLTIHHREVRELAKTLGAREERIVTLTAERDEAAGEVQKWQKLFEEQAEAFHTLTAKHDEAAREAQKWQKLFEEQAEALHTLTAKHDEAAREAQKWQKLSEEQAEALHSSELRQDVLRTEAVEQRHLAATLEKDSTLLRQSLEGHQGENALLKDYLARREAADRDVELTVRALQQKVASTLAAWGKNSTPQSKSQLRALLGRDGREFVHAAYGLLFQRAPDSGGLEYYTARLRGGSPKLELLGELLYSDEGRRVNCRIPGLHRAVLLQRLARVPLLGGMLALVSRIEGRSPLQNTMRSVHQEMAEISQSQTLHFRQIAEDLELLRNLVSRRPRPFRSESPVRADTETPKSADTSLIRSVPDSPAEQARASRQPIVFQLEYGNTASPKSVGLNDDTRELAIGVQRIRVIDEASGQEICDVNFKADGNARSFTLFGFSDNEEWGTWSIGKASAFFSWISPADIGDVRVAIDGRPFDAAFSEVKCVLTSSVGHRHEFSIGMSGCDVRVPLSGELESTSGMFFGGAFETHCTNNASLLPTRPRVSVIILNFNKPQLSLLSARSVLAAKISSPYEVIIVDNGSSADNFDILEASDVPVRIHRVSCNRYFGEGNNLGAEVARGEYLLFLNNDAFPAPGSIDALLQAFTANRSCGIAGPVFRYPDGRLQEAGGFIDAQGMAEQRGKFGARLDVASLPEFGQVDYVSAACLMIRADRFADLGGFNYRYDPAYYEDTDLCFRVRLRGEQVVLVRDSICFHIENATTADKRSATGVISTVDHNRKVFLSVWGKYLRDRSTSNLPITLIPPPSVHTRRLSKSGVQRDPATQAAYSPYPLVPGGGERFILATANALNQLGPATFVTPDPFSMLRLDNVMFDLGLPVGGLGTVPMTEVDSLKLDRVVVMGNELYPLVHLPAKRSFFHCQFPFPLSDSHKSRMNEGLDRLAGYEKVIVNSDFTKQAYETQLSRFGHSAVVEVVSPPVATKRLLALRQERKQWILSIGRFSAAGHSKRQDVLIEAMKATSVDFRKNWRLVLCGTVPNTAADRGYFKELQESVGNDVDVEFILSPSASVLDSLLAQSAIYAHACGFGVRSPDEFSRCEHFGITLVEALVAGCHIICYEVGGGPEIIARVGAGDTFGSIDELASLFERAAGRNVDQTIRERAAEYFDDAAFYRRMIAAVH
jgi:GT2 family glycosyltransferase/glycosyltransferase involved in cell wall biosynthesis